MYFTEIKPDREYTVKKDVKAGREGAVKKEDMYLIPVDEFEVLDQDTRLL